MYPLNLTKKAEGQVPAGFALANDEAEHAALTAQGFIPKLEPKEAAADANGDGVLTKDEVMAALDKAGIDYKKSMGIAALKALLPAA